VSTTDLAGAAPGQAVDFGSLEIPFRLPVEGWPLAVFQSDYGYRDSVLTMDGVPLLRARRDALEQGVEGRLPGAEGAPLRMQLTEHDGVPIIEVRAAGREAVREDRVWARPTLSAWVHAILALAGSAAGFAASYFYLVKAAEHQDAWALKMGQHTAAWHLLLTVTLFPASVWGQRIGIRAVQVVSLVFFLIHLGIALANSDLADPLIALCNAASGVFFLASTVYGNRAHRDMDPVSALRAGRA
jgi:hypothetical protein